MGFRRPSPDAVRNLGAAAIQAVDRDDDVLVDGGYALEHVDLLFVLRTRDGLAGEHERDVT